MLAPSGSPACALCVVVPYGMAGFDGFGLIRKAVLDATEQLTSLAPKRDCAAFDPGSHPEAVELDFMRPIVARGDLRHELG